ncbi:unnamed protein product [Effrenium voratum]|nr:unnamed protein product [Effrenium voratum]
MAKRQLTVRLPSGSLLVELAVHADTLVSQLKQRIEEAAELPAGRVVRWLVSGTTQLGDEESLPSDGELVAICGDVLVGDFETYKPGCPSCDWNSELQTARFFADGTALIHCRIRDEGKKFRYRLGGVQENMRELELEPENESDEAYAGTLQVSSANPVYRRVQIPELNIDVEDIRYLKQVGQTALEQRLALLFPQAWPQFHEKDEPQQLQWLSTVNPSFIPSDEHQLRKAIDRAWVNWQWQNQEQLQCMLEEHVLSIEELYDFTLNQTAKTAKTATAKQSQKQTQHKQKAVKMRKGKLLRWARPKMMPAVWLEAH